jgi:hypothetical protein
VLTRRQAFNAEADAIYRQRKRETFAGLRPGDVITADIGGKRVSATVLGQLSPDVLVQTEDGAEHLINGYQFGGSIVRRGNRG